MPDVNEQQHHTHRNDQREDPCAEEGDKFLEKASFALAVGLKYKELVGKEREDRRGDITRGVGYGGEQRVVDRENLVTQRRDTDIHDKRQKSERRILKHFDTDKIVFCIIPYFFQSPDITTAFPINPNILLYHITELFASQKPLVQFVHL